MVFPPADSGNRGPQIVAGEAKRILIARALVHQPKKLLLDEPTSNLDIAAQYELRGTMRQLAGEGSPARTGIPIYDNPRAKS